MALSRIQTAEIVDNAVTTAKVDDATVIGTDIVDGTIVNSMVAAGAAIAHTKCAVGTVAGLNVGTGANQILQLNGSGVLPALDGTLLTGIVSDFTPLTNNMARLGLHIGAVEQLAKYNMIDQVIDDYEDATGVVAFNGAVAITASSATGYETGDRTSTWTITTTHTLGGGTIDNIIDGTTSLSGNANSFYFNNETISGKYIRFQLPAHKVYTNAKWYHTTTTTYGTWRYQGSNDGSTWTNIGSTFTLGGGTTTYHTELSGNTTPYLYYQLLGVSGTATSAGNNLEIEFNMAAHSAGPASGKVTRVHGTSLAWS